jgi:LAO/AO transport system kinase
MLLDAEPKIVQKIQAGDVRALARAASWIENRRPEAEPLLRELFPRTGRALILGVTGAPGAGKSTLCDRLTRVLRDEGKTVGVIAVDPTSPYTGGALLGDRIRMQQHHADPGVFIRSMATRGWLGGLASATTEMTMLLDAAGYNVILVETVGVGQDEVEIARLADVTMVVLVPGMGDDVQALKAGIIEIADVFVINKADLPGAEKLERELKSYLGLSHRPDGWTPTIVHAVANEGKGISESLAAAREYHARGSSPERAAAIWSMRLREMLRERLLDRMPAEEFTAAGRDVAERRKDPYTILHRWLGGAGPRPADARQVGDLPHTAANIDHLGIAVRSLDAALKFYRDQLGLDVSMRETVEQEKVNVAMLPLGEPRIELLEPTEPDSVIAKFLDKRGEGLHHVALRVPDLNAAMERLRTSGARLLNEPRKGAGGHLYVFVHPASTGGVLLELIQE